MKHVHNKVFALMLVLLLANAGRLWAQEKPANAASILQTAFEQAGREQKLVLLIFHASWCIWCRKMDSSLNDPSCRDYFSRHYVIRELTVYESQEKKALENPGALELLTKYKGNDLGLPYWVVLDKNGNLLGDAQVKPGVNSGCPATEEEVTHFIDVLKATSNMSTEEEASIEKRFRHNSL